METAFIDLQIFFFSLSLYYITDLMQSEEVASSFIELFRDGFTEMETIFKTI